MYSSLPSTMDKSGVKVKVNIKVSKIDCFKVSILPHAAICQRKDPYISFFFFEK